MAEPFLSEIRIMSFNFPPKGWALCNGQLLPIAQNQALFSLLGTTYGGDGRVNFALPDLRSRVPFHMGQGHTLGEKGGTESVTLNISQLPAHLHSIVAGNNAAVGAAANASIKSPIGAFWANFGKNAYSTDAPNIAMSPKTVSSIGGNQAHLNMSPFLTLNFCIALQGIFPSQT